MESRIDHLEKTFQSKMTLIEGNNDALQNELAALRQEKHQQNEENKQLRDELTKLKVATEDSINNDLTNDSDGDNDGDDNNDTNDVSVMEGNSYALPEELVALKQKEIEHQEENQGQKERLTRMEAGIEDDANKDLNYDSSDNESSHENDINYDTECYTTEEDEEEEEEENDRNAAAITQMHGNSNEEYADPNYNSSDNEDPKNDIYLD
jgi:hypothetical protein